MSNGAPQVNALKQKRSSDVITANATITVPKNQRIESIVIRNTTANAVTGGIRIGTTNGGTDVVAAQAVAGNAFLVVPDAAILKRVFSTTAETVLYVQAVTGWNSASLVLNATFVTI